MFGNHNKNVYRNKTLKNAPRSHLVNNVQAKGQFLDWFLTGKTLYYFVVLGITTKIVPETKREMTPHDRFCKIKMRKDNSLLCFDRGNRLGYAQLRTNELVATHRYTKTKTVRLSDRGTSNLRHNTPTSTWRSNARDIQFAIFCRETLHSSA